MFGFRKLRRLLVTQLFSATKRMEATKALRMKKVQELVNFISESSQREEATTVNIISNILFSADLCSYDSKQSNGFQDTMIAAMIASGKPDVANFFPFLGFLDMQGIRKTMKGYTEKLFRGFIDAKIAEKSLMSNSKYDSTMYFLDSLLVLTEGDQAQQDHNDIEHLLLARIQALLEWAMAEFFKTPKKMAKAQAEIKCVIGKNGVLQESDLSELPYLQETFRLQPAAPLLLPREAETDVEILGFMVPKDTQILVSDPNVWDNPNQFEPERFLGKETDVRGRDYELTPFGTGRRICPGLPLAVKIVSLILASILYYFDRKLPNGVVSEDLDMDETFGITLHKTKPLFAVPVKKRITS